MTDKGYAAETAFTFTTAYDRSVNSHMLICCYHNDLDKEGCTKQIYSTNIYQ